MTINERFAEILKSKNISVKDTASLIGKSEVYVRKLMRAGESFGIEPVLLILNSIEDVNPDWLLREKGNMFRMQSEMKEPVPITNERLFSIIESQQRTIENLSNICIINKPKNTLMRSYYCVFIAIFILLQGDNVVTLFVDAKI